MAIIKSEIVHPILNISYPPYGDVTSNLLEIHLDVKNDTKLKLEFMVKGLHQSFLESSQSQLIQSPFPIEPSTWFYSIIATPKDSNDIIISSTCSYIEFVLSPQDIAKQRKFVQHYDNNHINNDNNNYKLLNNANKITNVCIWSGNTLDGQKRIWIEMVKYLSRHSFRFIWAVSLHGQLLSSINSSNSEDKSNLKSTYENVRYLTELIVKDCPFNNYDMRLEYLEQTTDDGYPTAAE
eukprot:gene18321-25797_t